MRPEQPTTQPKLVCIAMAGKHNTLLPQGHMVGAVWVPHNVGLCQCVLRALLAASATFIWLQTPTMKASGQPRGLHLNG